MVIKYRATPASTYVERAEQAKEDNLYILDEIREGVLNAKTLKDVNQYTKRLMQVRSRVANNSPQLTHLYRSLWCSLITWKGLPDEIDGLTSQNIETQLFDYGRILFFKHHPFKKKPGFTIYNALPFIPYQTGENNYQSPLFRQVWINFPQPHKLTFNISDSVIIHNSVEDYSISEKIKPFLEDILCLWETMHQIIKMQRLNYLVTTDNPEQLQDIMYNISNFNNIININKNGDPLKKGLNVLDLKVPSNDLKSLNSHLHSLKCEILTILGVNNQNFDKRERLLFDEVNANNVETRAFSESYLIPRRLACKRINQMFGLNLSVEYNQKLQPQMVKEEKPIDNQRDCTTKI